MENKMSVKMHTIIIGTIMALVLVVVLVLNILALTVYDNTLKTFIGYISVTSGTTDLDVQYYKTSLTKDQLKAKQDELSEEIAGNGIALLKHDDESGMPYAKNTAFSIFSGSSVNWQSAGIGSSGDGSGALTMKSEVEANGLQVNSTLWAYYHSN